MALSHDPLWPRAGDWNASDGDGDFGIIGVPTFSTSITPGSTHLTPDAVRQVLPRYSEVFVADGEIHTGARLLRHDFGDVVNPDGDEVGAIRVIAEAASRSRLLVAIGGDNALTVPVAVAAWGDQIATAGLITVDAHLDVRDGVSNGSPVRRLIEDFGVDPARVVQIAIADFANSTEYLRRVRDWGVTVITRDDVARRGVDAVVHEALAIAGADGGPIHVDLDIDACDRSVAPACPASIPGGLSAYEMRQFARGFARDDRVSTIDLAEVDASADTEDGRTIRLTALCVLEALAGLAER
jgi:formiminoglutamase